jgi:hypothetical protein
VTRPQAVVDHDVVTPTGERFRRVAADVPGATGHQNGSQTYRPIEK